LLVNVIYKSEHRIEVEAKNCKIIEDILLPLYCFEKIIKGETSD